MNILFFFFMGLLLAFTFPGCQVENTGYQNEESVFPFPVNHPDAWAEEDLSLIEEISLPDNLPAQELSGAGAIDNIVSYDFATGAVKEVEDALLSRPKEKRDFVEPFIPEYAKPKHNRLIWGSGRYQITNTTVYPNCTIAKVIITFQSGTVKAGTGTIVGYKHLLTAGHCVRHPTYGWAASMQIIPGFNNGYQPFGESWGTYAHLPDQWSIDMNVDYDYALITLNTEIGRDCGWHGFGYMGDYYIQQVGVKVYGYPTDLSSQQLYQYVSFDSVRNYSSSCIFYWADTWGGQSGGPVISTSNYLVNFLIAVHSGANSTHNRGSRITLDRFNWINNIKTANGDY
jgi:V8-like Glu-specific endopeptidase